MTTENQEEEVRNIVLVSADSEFVKTVEPEVYEATGFHLTVAENNLSAVWEQLLEKPIDALLVDLGEIDLGGLESLQHIKRALPADTPILIMVEDYNTAIIRMLFQMQINDFLVKPVTAKELHLACVSALKTSAKSDREDAEIFAFLPAAGGVGNTVLAIQTAFLRHTVRRGVNSTCLVDMNFQTGSCTEYLDLEPRFLIEDIENEVERLDRQLLETMLAKHHSGLSVLAAPNVISEQRTFNPDIVVRLLDLVSTYFDNVIIDMPRIWFPWTETVLRGANQVFVTAEATVPCMRHTQRLIKGIAQETNGDVSPHVIVNRYSDNGSKNGVQRSDMEKVLGDAFAGTISNNYQMVCRAIDTGVPLHEIDPNAQLIEDLRSVVLKDEVPQAVPKKSKWLGLGSKFKRRAG